jgi:LemA protein
MQEQLSEIEAKIASARQMYNDAVIAFNIKAETLPDNLIAGTFGFNKRYYFQIDEIVRSTVKVQF